VVSLASLAGAGLDASAQVGDEDLVQAVDDQLRTYPATAVVLVVGALGREGTTHSVAAQLDTRLRVPLLQVDQTNRESEPAAERRLLRSTS
jgi:hypothetical protein